MTFTDRELGVLHRLDLLDAEGARAMVQPDHLGDLLAGFLWDALGTPWRPKHYYASWTRGQQQQVSRTRTRLMDAGLIGQHVEPTREAFGIPWDTTSRWFLTGEGQDVVKATALPADLRRFCRTSGCTRWLTPLHADALCHRHAFSPESRLTVSRKFRTRFGAEESSVLFVESGLAEVHAEELLTSRKEVAVLLSIAAYQQAQGIDLYAEVMAERHGLTPPPLPASLAKGAGLIDALQG